MSSGETRLFELLALRATQTLEKSEAAELETLLEKFPDAHPEEFELAAAAVHEALSGVERELPASLRSRLIATGLETMEESHDTLPSPDLVRAVPTGGPLGGTMGWWAAAAALALAVLGWWPRLGSAPEPVVEQLAPVVTVADVADVADLRNDLLAEQATLSLPWTATEDATATAASGDVVWNGETQTGFMRFSGLAANNPDEFQYQLWIFDRERDERYPVDGGVFDIGPESGEVIVPIDPKIGISEPYLFAVTIEAPGGAVVSSRERIALLAQS